MRQTWKQCPKCGKEFTSPHIICPECGALLNVKTTQNVESKIVGSRIKSGIYGRAFEWNIAKTEKKTIPNIAEALVALSAADHLDIFEDYLTISKRRKNNLLAMIKLQIHLIDDLVVLQHAIKHDRKNWEELKAEQEQRQTDEQLTQDLKIVERELFFHRAYANCIRGIGDGIAWRALGYDRVALRALSGNAVKQQILDPGSVTELRHWASAVDTGKGFPIFNAMTNWLALGDVTVVRHDGVVEIVEVKASGAGSSRVSRQRQRMREATGFLRDGKGILEVENVTAVRLSVPLENSLPALRQLLEGAGKTGWLAILLATVVM